jgi:hypothetical protein
MAIYFGADHLVWAYQIGLTTDKAAGERWQKLSLRAWALGSLCSVAVETYQILMSSVTRKEVRTIDAQHRCPAATSFCSCDQPPSINSGRPSCCRERVMKHMRSVCKRFAARSTSGCLSWYTL